MSSILWDLFIEFLLFLSDDTFYFALFSFVIFRVVFMYCELDPSIVVVGAAVARRHRCRSFILFHVFARIVSLWSTCMRMKRWSHLEIGVAMISNRLILKQFIFFKSQKHQGAICMCKTRVSCARSFNRLCDCVYESKQTWQFLPECDNHVKTPRWIGDVNENLRPIRYLYSLFIIDWYFGYPISLSYRMFVFYLLHSTVTRHIYKSDHQ